MIPIDQIQQYEQAHKKTMYIIIGIIVLLLAILIFRWFYGNNSISIKQDKNAVQLAIDSLRQEGKLLHNMRISDSIRISDIQHQIDDTQDQLDNINKRYATQRTKLANSTIDTRLNFFTGHLPKSGNSR